MTDPYAPAALRAPDRPPHDPRAGAVPPDATTLAAVRPEVRRLLEASPGFHQLPPEEQRDLARKMVRVSSYMANPDGLAAEELSDRGGVLARAQADGVDDAKKRASSNPGFAGEDFQAGAVRQGTEQFGELVQKVDFPAFVSGLIQNVFQAIVDSSIQQMRAYGELLANVAKSVEDFATDNISTNNARDWLAQRYPDDLSIEVEQAGFGFADGADPFGEGGAQPTPRLSVTSDDERAFLARLTEELGLAEPVTDLSDAAQEARLARAAQLQIARSRQQLLASMVMLGINRIVVTDGQINAKVVFGMRASDVAARESKASLYDRKQDRTSQSSFKAYSVGWGIGGGFGADRSSSSTDHVTTVRSSLDETSESQAEVKARLSGEVRVNFKSDYLPMEKMASPEMIAAIQGRSQPLDQPVEGA